MEAVKENPVVKKSIAFSLAVIKYCALLEELKRFIIARQLLRSATSIGANILEAQNSESKADFIHKMKIAAKEASETQYWLTLCEHSEGYCFDYKLKFDAQELGKLLSKIIATSKARLTGK